MIVRPDGERELALRVGRRRRSSRRSPRSSTKRARQPARSKLSAMRAALRRRCRRRRRLASRAPTTTAPAALRRRHRARGQGRLRRRRRRARAARPRRARRLVRARRALRSRRRRRGAARRSGARAPPLRRGRDQVSGEPSVAPRRARAATSSRARSPPARRRCATTTTSSPAPPRARAPSRIARMEELLQKWPDFALADRALFWLGQRLAEERRSDDAVARFAEVERRFPSSEWALRAKKARADLLLSRGHPFVARAALPRADGIERSGGALGRQGGPRRFGELHRARRSSWSCASIYLVGFAWLHAARRLAARAPAPRAARAHLLRAGRRCSSSSPRSPRTAPSASPPPPSPSVAPSSCG